eukprot:SAG25_NODE_1926_length_2139_cov_147.309651_1_plen_160_part_00
MPYDDPEKIRAYNRRKYQEQDKGVKKEIDKSYYENNKDKIKKRTKAYYKTDTAQIKLLRRNGWKHSDAEFLEILERFKTTTKCELCNCEMTDGFKKGNRKVKDHHHISGTFRNICCNRCNMERSKIDNRFNFVLLELHRYFNLNDIYARPNQTCSLVES